MALENEDQDQQHGSAGSDGADTGDDLSDVLGNPDATFVSGEKKPLNTGTLIMGGFLLACGIGTYFMYTRSAPAAIKPSAEAAAAQTTITQFLSDDKANVSKMKELLVNTEAAVEQFRESPGKAQVPVEDLQTNPFRFAVSEPDDEVKESVDTLTERKREEEARAATLKAAQALNLQFVVSGKRKSCMINNARCVEGQAIGEFTVESISTDGVVIRKGDLRFKLSMKK